MQLYTYCIELLMSQFFRRLMVHQLRMKCGTSWKKCLRVSTKLNRCVFKLYEVNWKSWGWRIQKMYLITLLVC